MEQSRKVKVWEAAENLRSKYSSLGRGYIPLDIITFVELELKLDLIPYEGLREEIGADAAILSDFSGIYVEADTYARIDTAPGWKLNRLRFSMAHELGHLCLHKSLFKEQGITQYDHLHEWLNEHNGIKNIIESEADEFAGRLLVPRDHLIELFETIKPSLPSIYGQYWVNDIDLRTKVCERIAEKFGVHQLTISARLNREEIWHEPYIG